MHWADSIAEDIINSGKHKPYWVDDMKTPSGRIHVGSLRGVLIHDLVYKALLAKNMNATYTYVFNDLDPMDALPGYLDPKYEQYMGVPVCKIPAPDGQSESFAKQFANDFIAVMNKLGVTPKIVWSHELYESGQMNDTIREALGNVEGVRKVYLKVAKQQKPEGWYPFQVICEQCGKLGTTVVNDWNGKEVHYVCDPNLVKWAKGCAHEGWISPFNGTGKLMWKVDWPAHWKVIGITIEGAGKDHSSDGGSRDIAIGLLKEVFHYPNPYDIPYEWLLIGGRKMSSSKGVGTSAADFASILPPSVARFLFTITKFNQQINFNPEGDTIPDLFDQYDEAAREYWQKGNDKMARAFELAQISNIPEEMFLPRFRDLGRFIQDPKINLLEKLTELKGSSLTEAELKLLEERKYYVKLWLERFAPQDDIFTIAPTLPKEAESLTEPQKSYLKAVALLLDQHVSPESLQQEMFEVTKKMGIPAKQAFAAIYLSLIGKTHGPKAAWFLLENKEIARERFMGLDAVTEAKPKETFKSSTTKKITLGESFKNNYPSATVGFAIMTGLNIAAFNKNLEKERQELLKNLEGLTTEQLNESPELQSYRKMYKKMGVDWHSRRPSPEALLRRIATGKGLYQPINTCVDAYNLIVMKHRVSVGAFDADKIKFPVKVEIAKGGESAYFIGDKDTATNLKTGEVCYFDEIGPYNMDYNYRDALRSAVTVDTKNIWINAEGVFDISPEQVINALDATLVFIQKYCGGVVEEKGVLRP